MATKKSASTAKKSTAKKSSSAAAKTKSTKTVKKPTTTTVVKTAPTPPPTAARKRFNFSRAPLLAASMAEFIGTFLLAAIVLVTGNTSILILFALITIVLAIGAISGAHVNPAITIGAWVTRRIKATRAISYIIAQVLGAVLALVVVNGFVMGAPEPAVDQQQAFGQQPAASAQVFKISEILADKEWYFLAAELIGTAIFAFGVASTTLERNRMAAAFTVGGSLFLGLTITGYLTGAITGIVAQGGIGPAVLNPAAAAAVQGISWSVWPIAVYALAPVIGGVLGFALRDLLRDEGEITVSSAK